MTLLTTCAAREAIEMAREALKPFSRVAKWFKPPKVDWVQYVSCVSIYTPTSAASHVILLEEADFQRAATALAALDALKDSNDE